MNDSATSPAVLAWWAAMSLVGVINIGLWIRTARRLQAERNHLSPADLRVRQWQLLLSGVYVVVCAFRGMLPRADVQRICFVDSFWASIFVGRSVATIAELCFTAQLSLTVRSIARSVGAREIVLASYLPLALIAVAETSSWYAVLTTNYRGNFYEESLWTVMATVVALCCAVLLRKTTGRLRTLLVASIAGAAAYVLFMITVDLRMYGTRLQADEALGRAYLTLSEGLSDVIHRRVVTFAWADWHDELAWMFLYFSVVVWFSIALVNAPRLWSPKRAA